jgi:hypothetical protein
VARLDIKCALARSAQHARFYSFRVALAVVLGVAVALGEPPLIASNGAIANGLDNSYSLPFTASVRCNTAHPSFYAHRRNREQVRLAGILINLLGAGSSHNTVAS